MSDVQRAIDALATLEAARDGEAAARVGGRDRWPGQFAKYDNGGVERDMNFDPSVEPCREINGSWRTQTGDSFGLFYVPHKSFTLKVIACDGEETGWEHVSVSLTHRTPNWDEMCFIKALFWGDDETVVQFHPKVSEYVNQHPHCLHLWRPTTAEVALPPKILV